MRRSRQSNAMTRQAITRVGFYLLAATLFAVQMPHVSLAQKAASGGGGTSASGGDSADHATGQGTSAQSPSTSARSNDSAGHTTGAGDNGSAKSDIVPAKPGGAPQAGGHETSGTPNGMHAGATSVDSSHAGQAHDATAPIDAHIAPPTRLNENRFSARDSRSKFKIIGSSPRPRSVTGRTTPNGVTRNSIGLAVPSQPDKLDHDNKPAVPVTITPAANAPVISAAKTEPTLGHPITTHPTISAPINGATIGGNANIRRGSNPAVIGGQTKTVVGINGSTITRRTH
jgi:hypothetical protein